MATEKELLAQLEKISKEMTALAAQMEANQKQQKAVRFVLDYGGELTDAARADREKAGGIVAAPTAVPKQ